MVLWVLSVALIAVNQLLSFLTKRENSPDLSHHQNEKQGTDPRNESIFLALNRAIDHFFLNIHIFPEFPYNKSSEKIGNRFPRVAPPIFLIENELVREKLFLSLVFLMLGSIEFISIRNCNYFPKKIKFICQ